MSQNPMNDDELRELQARVLRKQEEELDSQRRDREALNSLLKFFGWIGAIVIAFCVVMFLWMMIDIYRSQ